MTFFTENSLLCLLNSSVFKGGLSIKQGVTCINKKFSLSTPGSGCLPYFPTFFINGDTRANYRIELSYSMKKRTVDTQALSVKRFSFFVGNRDFLLEFKNVKVVGARIGSIC